MRGPPPGEGPSLVSGEAYQYQLRHIRQNLDPGDALAAERAISDLAKNADDAWSLLAVCAISAPLPHSVEVIDRSTFVAWLMQPEQKNHPMAGRRARSSSGAPGAVGTPKGRSRSLPGRRALAQAQPSGATSLPDVTALDPKKVPRRPGRRSQQSQPHSPRNPQPPQQSWVMTPESLAPQSPYLPPPPVAVSERPPATSGSELPAGVRLVGCRALPDAAATRPRYRVQEEVWGVDISLQRIARKTTLQCTRCPCSPAKLTKALLLRHSATPRAS